MVLFLGSSLLCLGVEFFGLFWGAYATFKALKATDEEEQKRKAALQFWAVWSALSLFDRYVEWVLSWIPLYFECKLALLVWLLWPSSGASAALFTRVLDPLVRRSQASILPRAASLALE
jgi:receptor expression-enhancing protein 5/6